MNRVRHPNLMPITAWCDAYGPIGLSISYAEVAGETFLDAILPSQTIHFNDPRNGPFEWQRHMTRAHSRSPKPTRARKEAARRHE